MHDDVGLGEQACRLTVSRSGSPGPAPTSHTVIACDLGAARSHLAPRRRTVGAGSQSRASVDTLGVAPVAEATSIATACAWWRSAAKRSSSGRRWAVSSSSGTSARTRWASRSPPADAADVDVVVLLRAPDDADLGAVRAGAAVRAPGHVEPDRRALVAGVGEQLLEFVDHAGQHALGLAERLAARRQRRAGDRQAAHRAHVVGAARRRAARSTPIDRVAVADAARAAGPGGR